MSGSAISKASEQRYQSLYEHYPFMYFTLSSDGTMLSVNNFGADQLGYEKDELIGRSILQLFDRKDHQSVLGQLIACATSPYTVFEWDIQKIRKEGVRIWVKERARAIHDHTNQILVLVVCEDVTERKRTEKQLQETSRLLHTLVEESPLPIVSLDREARVVSWNQAATRLFGCSLASGMDCTHWSSADKWAQRSRLRWRTWNTWAPNAVRSSRAGQGGAPAAAMADASAMLACAALAFGAVGASG